MFHLLADITHHGFGHVSQATAVINALAELMPETRVTIRSTAPHAFLASRLHCEFSHISEAYDFGMKMHNAVEVDVAGSLAAYREFHRSWPGKIQAESEKIKYLKPDLLLGNVPYLSLAAAARAGIRAVGMCSLNWADIYKHYCGDDAGNHGIHGQMLEAYQSAFSFLRLEPAMPMPDFGHSIAVAPIARAGKSVREEICRQYSIPQDSKLVMMAMGGMDYPLDMHNWPVEQGRYWIVPGAWHVQRTDVISFESMQRHFTDVLASCDAVITKPGYGTFTEAACAGVPVLYVSRGDWPEEPCLVEWLRSHAACLEISKAQLAAGELNESLLRLWAMPRPPRPAGTGAQDAARYLRDIAD